MTRPDPSPPGPRTHPSRPHPLAGLLGLALLAVPAGAQEGRLPGYYPTAEEVDLLGSESREMYGRHSGGITIDGPDSGSLTASGLWHQDSEPTDSFYERHDGLFRPLDSALGILAPREVLMLEADAPRRARLYGYADPGFMMTRNFNPDLATMKLGPFYLDLLSLSGTALYSDYEGTPALREEDGWISSVNLDFRGAARLTQNLYLALSGSAYYLPCSGDVGFYIGNGTPTFLRIGYENSIGDWDYVIFNEFTAHHRLSDIFDEVEHDEIDWSGRYRFGRVDNTRGSDYFESDEMFFINRLGTAFYGPLGDVFEARLTAEHVDYWDTLDFDHLTNWDRLNCHIDYTGFDAPIIPYFEYELTAIDDWDTIHHSLWLGARARITENLRADGRAGYFFSSGNSHDFDRPIGELGLIHDITENTSHSLYGGVRHHIWEDAEDLLATYLRYSLAHSFGSRLRGTAFAQFSDLENLDGRYNDRDGWSTGAQLSAHISDYTHCMVSVRYDDWDYAEADLSDQQRWIYRATLQQRLLPYLHARLTYQYEDYEDSGADGYDEHLYLMSLNYLF